jgi:hypothetical protein
MSRDPLPATTIFGPMSEANIGFTRYRHHALRILASGFALLYLVHTCSQTNCMMVSTMRTPDLDAISGTGRNLRHGSHGKICRAAGVSPLLHHILEIV